MSDLISVGHMNDHKYPFISVVIPVRNEERYIKDSLMSIINQDYPKDRYEIIIADGMSEDGTIRIINSLKKRFRKPAIRLYTNKKRTTSTGVNLCIRKSRGNIIVRFMGHAIADRNFIRSLTTKLIKEPKSTIMVSCVNDFANPAGIGRYIGLSMKSILGGLGSCYRKKKTDCYEYSGGFGAIRKKDFIKIGMLNERITCGDDADLNFRIRKKGYRVLITPDTSVKIFKRESVKKFIYQMVEFGEARGRIIKKYPEFFNIIYFIPPLFFLYLLFLPLLFSDVYKIPIITYIIIDLLSSVEVSEKIQDIPSVMLFVFMIHVFYGFGMIKGLLVK